jgi:hypothetical protein
MASTHLTPQMLAMNAASAIPTEEGKVLWIARKAINVAIDISEKKRSEPISEYVYEYDDGQHGPLNWYCNLLRAGKYKAVLAIFDEIKKNDKISEQLKKDAMTFLSRDVRTYCTHYMSPIAVVCSTPCVYGDHPPLTIDFHCGCKSDTEMKVKGEIELSPMDFQDRINLIKLLSDNGADKLALDYYERSAVDIVRTSTALHHSIKSLSDYL